MNHLVHKLTLDMHKSISQTSITVKKGDTKRKLYITLTENGKVYTVSNSCTAVFSATKYNNDILFNDCTIEDGIIVYEFTELTANIPGMMDCEIRLYGADNGLITSPQFSIIVEGVVNKDSDVMASDEYSALTSAIAYVDTLKRDLEDIINNSVIDDKLDPNSTHAVQNKVVAKEIENIKFNYSNLSTGVSALSKRTPPVVTNNDNGKLLQVVDGVWEAVTIPFAEGVSV